MIWHPARGLSESATTRFQSLDGDTEILFFYFAAIVVKEKRLQFRASSFSPFCFTYLVLTTAYTPVLVPVGRYFFKTFPRKSILLYSLWPEWFNVSWLKIFIMIAGLTLEWKINYTLIMIPPAPSLALSRILFLIFDNDFCML